CTVALLAQRNRIRLRPQQHGIVAHSLGQVIHALRGPWMCFPPWHQRPSCLWKWSRGSSATLLPYAPVRWSCWRRLILPGSAWAVHARGLRAISSWCRYLGGSKGALPGYMSAHAPHQQMQPYGLLARYILVRSRRRLGSDATITIGTRRAGAWCTAGAHCFRTRSPVLPNSSFT